MIPIFRYVAIVPPRRISSDIRLVPVDVANRAQSRFIRELEELRAADALPDAYADAARRFQATVAFRNPLGRGFERLPMLRPAILDRPVQATELIDAAVAALGLDAHAPAASLRMHLNSPAGRSTRQRLVEGVLSLTHCADTSPVTPDELIGMLKTLNLLSDAVNGRWPFPGPLTLDGALDRMTAVIPSDLAAVRIDRRDPAAKDRPPPPLDPKITALEERLALYDAALEELEQPKIVKRIEMAVQVVQPGGGEEDPSPRTGLFSPIFRGVSLRSMAHRRDILATPIAPVIRIAPEQFDLLSAETKGVLAELGLSRDATDHAGAVQALEGELVKTQEQLRAARPSRYGIMVANMRITVSTAKPRPSPPFEPTLNSTTMLSLSCPFYAGQGELRIVGQNLVAYELGDIAHVENVLAGEEKERTHRRLDRTEEVERELAEQISEVDRELQSTDRHELETEAQSAAQMAVHVDGGITVSGSYGPTVSFTANASAGFSYQTESSSRRASRFAQEVVERTVERIKERTERERRVTRIREIEETNRHAVLNTAQDTRHIRGVYRWLNKIYQAQVYTYGIRQMLEFTVPEPAAFYLWSLTQQPQAAGDPLPILESPDFGPGGIHKHNWYLRAADYGAQGVEPPPPLLVQVAHTSHIAAKEKAHHAHTHVLKVPDGYEAFGAVYNVARASSGEGGGGAGWLLQIHKQQLRAGKTDMSGYIGFLDGARVAGDVAIGFRDWGNYSYSISVNLQCILTDDRYNKWRFDVFTAIADAYRDYEADQQARLAQASIGEGISIPGRNPAVNQRIIRDELQRGCLSLLTGTDMEQFDGFMQSGEPDEWRINSPRALRHGKEAQFLQNAFEWENMTFVFYPYFYGRSGTRWIETLHQIDDPDPLFSAFLRAGMARVQVPVRDGFEAVVARYCQDGALWGGNDAPLIGDDLHVPIVDEIRRSLDAPNDGIPVGPPWEVRVPTSLVLLEDAANLQGFRDALFGDPAGDSQINFQ